MEIRDVSAAARQSLRGQRGATGPAGPQGPAMFTFSAAVRATGEYARARGTQTSAAGHDSGTGAYSVLLNSDVSGCYAVASIAGMDGVEPDDGEIVTSISGSSVFVRTRTSSGAPADLPFHLIVSC